MARTLILSVVLALLPIDPARAPEWTLDRAYEVCVATSGQSSWECEAMFEPRP
ncbi:hypothetical protein [uncultured Brevundimonas sp.]|uniref:hypothetical protein n=1 Tax=uncultured Brevundimonas sp. TaxID=213418 RepID=UPI0025EC7DDC|nr:hypothetical protein [uncultured Brevundimonas sp.]